MPKPALLTRPSGLYVRFCIPKDLQSVLGRGSVVRSLRGRRGDEARLVAAACGVALSRLFARMRAGGNMADIKKLLDSAQQAADAGSAYDWTASGVQVGRVNLGNVSVHGRQDTEGFIKAVQALLEAPTNVGVAALTPLQVAPASAQDPSPNLSEEIQSHLADLERCRLAPDTITESKHALRIFLATTGDIPVREIKATHARALLRRVRTLAKFRPHVELVVAWKQ